jgi:surface protein
MNNITIIDNNNIRDLVTKYINNKDGLPADLKIKKIGDWNVSNVTNMERLFLEADKLHNFNEPLNKWNVSKVENMSDMFSRCKMFNQPLNNWDVSNVKDMDSMFSNCEMFNQPLNNWNVSKVENMHSMFNRCTMFNQPLNNWDVSNVKNMSAMFLECKKFKQKLNNWNINNIEKWEQFNVFELSAMSNYSEIGLDYYPNGFLQPRLDTLELFEDYERSFKDKLNNEVLDDIKEKVSNDIDFEYIDEIFDYINEKLLQIIEESVSDRNKINIEEINDKIKKIMIDFKIKITENNKTKITERVLYTLVIYILESITNQTPYSKYQPPDLKEYQRPEFKEYFINEFISNYNLKNENENVIIVTMTGIDGVFERLTKCLLEPLRYETLKKKFYKVDESNTNMGGRKHKVYKTMKKHKRCYKKTGKNNKKNNKLRK